MTTMIEHVVWILVALIAFFVINMLTGITGIICGCLRYPLKRLLFLKAPPEMREEYNKRKKGKRKRTESEDDENSEANGQENSAVQDEEDAEGQ